MHASPLQQASAILFGVPPFCLLIAALLCTSILAAKNRRTLGALIAVELPGRAWRRYGMSCILLGVVGVLLAVFPDGRVVAYASAMLVPSLGLVWLGPGFEDALLGEGGVQRGWYSRRFDELEEWRLSGEHLRFRLFGEWTAVPCPAAAQPRLRELLTRLNPARESPFQD